MKNSYDDIIHLPHPVSATHPPMSRQNRAAQFAPFAALTGYEAAVRETARLTDQRIELDEYEKDALNEKLQLVAEQLSDSSEIEVTYFLPDQKKAGGAYVSATGQVKKIDEFKQLIVFQDGKKIPIEEIIEIDGELFKNT